MAKFNLSDWDARRPMFADTGKPWGEYHVFQDFSVDGNHSLPEKILNAIHRRFAELINSQPELVKNELVVKLADNSNDLAGMASADEKILLVEPKQPGFSVLSMQYHGRKGLSGHIEVWEFLTPGAVVIGSDSFKPFGWDDSEIAGEMSKLRVLHLQAGEMLVIFPGQWHALAKSENQERVVVREWRITPEAGKSSSDREENIVRTYDNAGRGTLGEFPKEIMKEIG